MQLQTLGNIVAGQMSRTQAALKKATEQLSTGLRINSAMDDPSGLAVSASLSEQANGLQVGQAHAQDCNNACTVAEGSFSTIDSILQRMRQLVVEANTDINSPTDLADIQTELDQLRLEVDHISEKTQFNGKVLLDGSLSSDIPKGGQALFPVNPQLEAPPNPVGTTLWDPVNTAYNPSAQTVQVSLSLDSYDPTTAPPTISVTLTASSPDPSFGPTQQASFTVDEGTNYPSGGPPGPIGVTDQYGNPVIDVQMNNIYGVDVGKNGLIATVPAQTKQPGQAMMAQVSGIEGDAVTVDIPAVNSTNLGINQILVGPTQLETGAAEARVDYAIDYMSQLHAHVGAQEAALQTASNNAAITFVNEQSSAAAIRDLNVGAATVEYTKDQIFAQMQTQVLDQVNASAVQVTQLVDQSAVHSAH